MPTDKTLIRNSVAEFTHLTDASMGDNLVVGVDIGGTKVAAGLVNPVSGQIIKQSRVPMAAAGDAMAGLAAVTTAIDHLFAEAHTSQSAIGGIGICAPGPLDPNTGVIINPPNVPCWRNFPLADEIAKKYGSLVKVDNDANAAALAETLWGAGRDYQNVFYATIGTGIGSGIIFNGHIYHGRTGAAAEGGHVTIDYRGPLCNCGKRGCIETLASGPAIARDARARIAAQPANHSMILELAGGSPDAITSEMVGKAYAAGDALAREVLLHEVELITAWLGSIVDLLEPDVIIIGGGVAGMLVPLFGEIRNRLPSSCLNSRSNEIPLVHAFYGADAGIAGGAALCSATPK